MSSRFFRNSLYNCFCEKKAKKKVKTSDGLTIHLCAPHYNRWKRTQ